MPNDHQSTGGPGGCSAPPACEASVTVHVVTGDRGSIMRIGHDGGTVYLDRDEAFELYNLLQTHLGKMPVKL